MGKEPRHVVWTELSYFYLDTELSESVLTDIVGTLRSTGYDRREISRINRREVAPVLYGNLLSVAGIWTGFREDILIAECTKQVKGNDRWWARMHRTLAGVLLRQTLLEMDRTVERYWEA
ncbi:DUF7079 family protein [Neolewinella antarctica]|uniref:DUF7079 domain-containing protein n=1 Tax=Neolewinella antarctica TaxID=442734 RepID=A0ABX0XFB0_9BACT|nr:hypothetical protein [Neolewinella antarctica]NJC27912.1 hypothetical protein [Neolewinella antarctica]